MPTPAMRSVPAFVPEALAASHVGTWEYDVDTDCMRGDATTAHLFDLKVAEAETGLPGVAFQAAIHPEDNARADPMRAMVRERGGILVFEVRMMVGPVVRCWVLIRGAYTRDTAGRMHGRGIAIDVTASKMGGALENHTLIVAEPCEPLSALDEAADYAIAARQAIDRVGGTDGTLLRKTVDGLLWAIGHVLAKRDG